MGLLVVLAVALLLAVPALRAVPHQIAHIGLGWGALALLLELGSAVSFVVVFRLFFDRLPAHEARALAWTEQGSGALLPGGGAGGLAIGGLLMHVAGMPGRWIVRRSAGLFFLGAAVSSAALVGAGVALIVGAPGPHDIPRVVVPTALAAVATLLVGALPIIVRSRRPPRWLAGLATGVHEAEEKTFTRRPSWRLVGSLGYLGFDIAVLWVLLNAVGPPPSVAVVVLAYSIGYAANSLPVPGGIGVLDAGLVGALVLYGVSPARAAAAVIVYHTIAFWVPGLGGLVAYFRLRPRLLRAGADKQPGDAQASSPQTSSPQTSPQTSSSQTSSSAETSTPASKEAQNERSGTESPTHRPRLGRDPHRRPRAGTLHWAGR